MSSLNHLSPACRLPLTPELTEEDRQSVENVAVIAQFLLGANTGSDTLREVAPLLPEVAAQMLPGIAAALASRVAARALREAYLAPAA
jgi:aarF domain-containing kinase